jgi:hypothetical protein
VADEENMRGGSGNRTNPNSRGVSDSGPRNDVAGTSDYLNLPARDRDAIRQSAQDRVPQEYDSQVEQYLRNLSDEQQAGN